MPRKSKQATLEIMGHLKDLNEITKVKLTNLIFEACNNSVVEMSTDDASRLIRVMNEVMDDCYGIVASKAQKK